MTTTWTNKTKSGQTGFNLWSPKVKPWLSGLPWQYDFLQYLTIYINQIKN